MNSSEANYKTLREESNRRNENFLQRFGLCSLEKIWFNLFMPKIKLAIATKIVGVILAVYVLIYMVLSLNGSYQPASVDLRGVMWYEWAPGGFYDADHAWNGSLYAVRHPTEKTGGWNGALEWTFLPLYYIDNHFIHKWSYDGKSPEKE